MEKQIWGNRAIKLKRAGFHYSMIKIPKPNFCEICKKIKKLHVHHIIPLSEDGEHSIKNLIFLCPTCHRKVHSKKIILQREGEKVNPSFPLEL